MTELLFLGQAGFILEHRGIRILMDPWFFAGFMESWFPYPDNRMMLKEVAGKPFDFLYVSHLHEDHFDRRTLELLPKDIPVVCANFRSGELHRRMQSVGFEKFILLGHQERREFSPRLAATMILDMSHKEDSGLLLELDGFRFLNLNDCAPRLNDLPSPVDLLAAQYSGAQWYPTCYDSPEPVLRQKVEEVRTSSRELLAAKCRGARPKWYIPCAGPACLLDPAIRKNHNPGETIFPLWEEVGDKFSAAHPEIGVLRIYPGDSIQIFEGVPSIRRFEGTREGAIAEGILSYADRRREEWEAFHRLDARPVTSAELSAYFSGLLASNRHALEGFKKTIRIVCGGRSWTLELSEKFDGSFLEETSSVQPEYTFSMPEQVLRAIVNKTVSWEHALAALRIRLHRNPDVYDAKLMGLLRYGDQPAQTRQMIWDVHCPEMIDVGGARIQRYCPHAGEDLSKGEVVEGVLTCPRHRWKWDLRTGKCVSGGSLDLHIEKS